MKLLIKIEELAMFLFCIFLFNLLDFSWWWFPLLLLAPDISMLGYLGGNKTGAATYNLFHHKGIALAVYVLGSFLHHEILKLAGVILLAHSSMDRLLGYGLKYDKGFRFTHLGEIGKKDIQN